MSENSMIIEIESLPDRIRDNFRAIDLGVREAFDFNELMTVKEIVIVGCGDSHMAGLATKLAFERLASIPTIPLRSMQAARYDLVENLSTFPRNPLTLGISVSGTVSRTAEAIAVARDTGSLTVGITSNPDGALGKAAEKVLQVPSPNSLMAPGVVSYRISMLALYMLAIRFAEVSGRIGQSEADHLRDELRNTASVMEDTIAKNKDKIKDFAEAVAEEPHFVFLGAGPNYASALFGAAKVIEAAGRNAVGEDLEEWAHLQYFENVRSTTPTFLITPQGPSHSRAVELLEPMKRLGRTVVGIVPDGEKTIATEADWSFPVVGQLRELFSPMVYTIPAEIFSAYLADAAGETFFRVSDEAYASGENTIRSSIVRTRSEFLEHEEAKSA